MISTNLFQQGVGDDGGYDGFGDDSGGGDGAGVAAFEPRLDGFERGEVEGAERGDER